MRTTKEITDWREANPGKRLDLSGANLRGAVLIDAVLRDANLSGANLRRADLRGAVLIDAVLRDANLSGADLRGAVLIDAVLRDANLSGADLRKAVLRNADLSGAVLPKVIKIENLFTEILSAIESGGKLHMGSWHECETTHCIAGWVITLAGEVGRVIEELAGAPWGATLIINESCPYLEGRVPNFYATDEEGMAFIKECVAKETKAAK